MPQRLFPVFRVLLTLLLIAPATAVAAADDLELVSRTDGAAGVAASNGAIEPTISRDGRLVAFGTITRAGNLGPADTRPALVRDLVSGTTRILSRDDGATGAVGSGFHAKIADSGAFACFITQSDAIVHTGVSGDYVVLRDLVSEQNVWQHAVTPAFRSTTEDEARADQDPYGRDCDVSDDGRRVVFTADDAFTDTADGNAQTDVYLVDRGADLTEAAIGDDTLELVSRTTAGSVSNADALNPSITPDGVRVAFRSRATNMTPQDDDCTVDVFVRNVDTDQTVWASRATGPAGGPGTAQAPPNNGSPLCHGSTDGVMSADGNLVAFVSTNRGMVSDVAFPDTVFDANTFQVYVRDLAAGTTELISRSTTPDGTPRPAGGYSDDPQLSSDGRYVSFSSWARGLDPERPTSDSEAIFIHDRASHRTSMVSRQPGVFGAPANGFANLSALSGDGRFVAFGASGPTGSDEPSNLLPGLPGNDPTTTEFDSAQVFRRELAPGRLLPVDLGGAPALTLPAHLPGLGAPIGATGRPATATRAQADGVPFTLSEYARLTTTLQRATRGRLLGTTCGPERKDNKLLDACPLFAALPDRASVTLTGSEGANDPSLTALLGALPTAAGRYRAAIAARDFAGQETLVSRDFTVGTPGPLDKVGRVRLARRSGKASRGARKVTLQLRCPIAQSTCRAALSLKLRGRVLARGSVKLGASRRTRSVVLRVSRSSRSKLVGRGRVRAILSLTTAGRGTERVSVQVSRARR